MGIPETVTSVLRHAQGHQVNFRFLQGDEVMLALAAEPHGVDVEVGDDHGVQDVHLFLPPSATR